MTTEHHLGSDERSSVEPNTLLMPIEQRRKAGQFLIRLQWLLIIILFGIILWLYLSQQRFEQEVTSRLQTNEQVTTRLNEMDDRLYAISQQTLAPQPQPIGSQAQNQLDLLRIQLQATDRLIEDSNYKAGVALLRGMLWQLSQDSNQIAPALTIVIKQSLKQDIEHLQAQSAQPSAWQLQNLAIADIQAFLRRQVRTSPTATPNTSSSPTKIDRVQQLVTHDVLIHEVIMTLNLAMQASNMRDRPLLLMYLQQAKAQLQPLQDNISRSPSQRSAVPQASNKMARQYASIEDDLDGQREANTTQSATDKTGQKQIDNLNSLQDVGQWLDKLIAEAPKKTPLITAQVLDSSMESPQAP